MGFFDDLIEFKGQSVNGFGPDLEQLRSLRIIANVVPSGGTVPEPATMMLLTMALATLLLRRRSMVH